MSELVQKQIFEIFTEGMSPTDAYKLRCAVRAETVACASIALAQGDGLHNYSDATAMNAEEAIRSRIESE
jgi:hypothetical protein